jgi:hypothetical protein
VWVDAQPLEPGKEDEMRPREPHGSEKEEEDECHNYDRDALSLGPSHKESRRVGDLDVKRPGVGHEAGAVRRQ